MKKGWVNVPEGNEVVMADTVEVLMAVMNEKDLSIVEKSNIHSDVLIINQTNYNHFEEYKREFGLVRCLSVKDKGLSRSRNLALDLAKGDICLLCDDDVIYTDNYVEIVQTAFAKIDKADIIIFEKIGSRYCANERSNYAKHIKKAPWYKNYPSVVIAFKRKSILDNQICFHTLFGAGAVYEHGEDFLFCRQCVQKKMKIYIYPKIILKLEGLQKSTWFRGYDEKFFFDTGALCAMLYPGFQHLFKWYYVWRLRKLSKIDAGEKIRKLNDGIQAFQRKLSYDDFYSAKS